MYTQIDLLKVGESKRLYVKMLRYYASGKYRKVNLRSQLTTLLSETSRIAMGIAVNLHKTISSCKVSTN